MAKKSVSLDRDLKKAAKLAAGGQIDEARVLYQALIDRFPENRRAREGLKRLSGPQASFLDQMNDLIRRYKGGEIDEPLNEALSLQATMPEQPDLQTLIGALYAARHEHEQAIQYYRTSLALNPDQPNTLNNLGNALGAVGLHEKAVEAYVHAIHQVPDRAETHNNLGAALKAMGRFTDAAQSYISAIKLKPDYAEAHLNLGIVLMSLGHFEEGREHYEWRMAPQNSSQTSKPPRLTCPAWPTSNPAQSLFVWPEQGIGDEVMFAALLPALQALISGPITVAADPRFAPLLARSFPDINVVLRDGAGAYDGLEPKPDAMIAMGSLPRLMGQLKRSVKGAPYLVVDEACRALWQERLSALPRKPNIGLSWRGGAATTFSRARSIDLQDLAPVLSLDANFINLQYGSHDDEIASVSKALGITIYDWDDVDPLTDLESFAAQIASLDLVVSVDNSTVHFAGALGTECFVLQPFVPNWRWLPLGQAPDWYGKTFRFFQQSDRDRWDTPILTAAHAVQEFLASRPT
ncbi:tetratricopeptide repeat-containing glycosyltransferase family protein [Coralliovum pocilloporae]|uniref:tetratricopeptide repeat-containing glycosyltransferase family protein n=1 Tax=Coralliovum pocilloporae TaxID=3066369 RepID=UPI003306F7A0